MYYSRNLNNIKSFSEKHFSDFVKEYFLQIRNEIDQKEKKYIISVDENKYISYLVDKYTLEPLEIIQDSEEIHKPTKTQITKRDGFTGRNFSVDSYLCVVSYSYKGSSILFSLSPSNHVLTTYKIRVNSQNKTVSFSFTIDRQDTELFKIQKNQAFKMAFTNLGSLNDEVVKWNELLHGQIKSSFDQFKQKYISENKFFEAISVKVNNKTKSFFSVPTIQKKHIPQPESKKKNFSSEPTITMELYKDILKVLYDMGKSMERKPSTYKGKSEEEIRDFLLMILETSVKLSII